MKIINFAQSYFTKYPPYLIFFVTSKCNSKCKTCFYWKEINDSKIKNELSLNEIKQIAKNYKKLTYLSIGGGEPTLREDLPEIIEAFYKNSKVPYITITTNGLLPSKIKDYFEQIFKNCKKSFFTIPLSIDGIGKNQDSIRGVKGCFEKVLETYNILISLKNHYKNFAIDVNTVISKFNEDKIEEIFKYVKNNMNEVRNHGICFARGNTKEKDSKDIKIERLIEITKFIENLKKRKRKKLASKIFDGLSMLTNDFSIKVIKNGKMPLPCLAGNKMVVLTETGDVYPCELLNQKFGSIKDYDYDILKILSTEKTKRIKNFIKNKGCSCTFECAIGNSIAYNPFLYPKLFKKILRM